VPDAFSLYPAAPNPSNNGTSDPLKWIGLIGQLNQNALFQQTFAARKAIGQSYQKAIRPDGSIDTPTLMREIQSRPDAGFLAGEASAGALQRQGQQILNTQAQFDLNAKRQQFLVDGLGSLADKDNPTLDDVRDFGVRAARNAGVPGYMVNGWIHGLPQGGPELKKALVTLRNMAIGSASLSTPDTTGFTSEGAPVSGTRGQAGYERAGVGVGGAGGSIIPGGGQIIAGGATVAPTPAAVAPAGPANPPGIAGLPPGSEKSAGMMQDDLIRAGNFGQEMLPMNQALDAANRLKQKYGTGYFAPGSQGRQEFQSFFYGVSPTLARWAGVDPEKLKNYAEAKKYLTQAVASRVGGFGAGTVEQLKTAAGGNPSVDINDMAVDDVLKMMIAARRMEHVQTLQASGGGGVNYTKNAAKWATGQDPKAFMLDLMSPAQIRDMEKRLKGEDRVRFNRSLSAAIQTGVISSDKVREILANESAAK
jgi:hypothetical protein